MPEITEACCRTIPPSPSVTASKRPRFYASNVAQRDADNKYRLIANGGDDGYEQDSQEIHCRMANCSERLINQFAGGKARRLRKTFSIISIWPPAMAISGPGNSFCLILRRKRFSAGALTFATGAGSGK